MSKKAMPAIRRCLRKISDAQVSDRDLLRRFLDEHDEGAFETLVCRHDRLIRSAIGKVLGDTPDADDAYQATFLVLVRRARAIDWRAGVGPWLYGVAHRIAVKARAQNARRNRQNADRSDRAILAPDLTWREACDMLHTELDRLPEQYRLPLLLCYLEGKTREEAAAALNVSIGTVTGRVKRGCDMLRDRLCRRGVTLSAGLLATVAAPSLPAASLVTPSAIVAAVSGAAHASVNKLAQEVVMAGVLSRLTKAIAIGVLSIGLVAGLLAVGAGEPQTRWAETPSATGQKEGASGKGRAAAEQGKAFPSKGRLTPRVAGKKKPRTPIVVEGEGSRVDFLAWSPNGRMVATVIQIPLRDGSEAYNFGVKVLDARTGKLLWTLIEFRAGFCSPVTFSPDSKTVAALVERKAIKLWDTATGKEKATFDVAGNGQCYNLVFSPDGKTLAAVGPIITAFGKPVGGYVRLFDARTGKVLWEQTKEHIKEVDGIAFSPRDGKTLASGSRDETVKLWDAATGKLLRTFEGHGEGGAYRVAFSPDGKTLASAGMDGTFRIWDVDRGKLRHTIEGYSQWSISFVAFSPRDGKTLLVAGYPPTPKGAEPKPVEIRLFDPQTGKAKRTVAVKGIRYFRDVAFSPDGKTLALGGDVEDKKMKLILLPLED